MVRAILDGRKTQTRRVVKVGKDKDWGIELAPCEVAGEVNQGNYRYCPYGAPGDRLWVRESFWGCDIPGHGDQPCVVYDDEWAGNEYHPRTARPWARKFGRIPSIHMPREASRITLEIKSVRVERLQDISEEDATAEGAPFELAEVDRVRLGATATRRSGFINLWQSINGPDSWGANPWVWVVEFERTQDTGGSE
jgi:hypothetical protein